MVSGETESQVSGWTVDTLHASMQQQFQDLRISLDERYRTQTREVDAAFLAQQTAMQTAFTAADKAVDRALAAQQTAMHTAFVAADKALDQRANTLDKEYHEHLEQVRHENALAFINSDKAIAAALLSAKEAVNAALVSSKEAVTKAEIAAEKRFESVNEFRAQLADQAATFVSRTEAAAYRLATEGDIKALKDQFDKADKRLDLAQGKAAGSATVIAYAVTVITIIVIVINAVFFALSQ